MDGSATPSPSVLVPASSSPSTSASASATCSPPPSPHATQAALQSTPSPSLANSNVHLVQLSNSAAHAELCSSISPARSLSIALDPRKLWGRASNEAIEVEGLVRTAMSVSATAILPACLFGNSLHALKRWAPRVAPLARQATACWTSTDIKTLGGTLEMAALPDERHLVQDIHTLAHWGGEPGNLSGWAFGNQPEMSGIGWVPHDTVDLGCRLPWHLDTDSLLGAANLPAAAWPAGWRKDDKGWLQARAAAEANRSHTLVFVQRRYVLATGRDAQDTPLMLLSHTLHAVAAWMLAAAYGPAARVVGVHVRRGDWAASCVKMEDCFISDEQYVAGAADALARFDMHNIYIASNDPKALLALLHKEVPLPPFTPALSPTDAAAGTPGRPMAVLPVLAGQYRSARARRAAAPANATTSPAPSSLLGLQVHRILTLDDLMTALTQMCKGAGTASDTLPPFVRVQDPAQEHVHDYMLPDTCAVWHSWAPGGKATGKMLGWLDKAVLTLASCVMGTPESTFSGQALGMRRAQFGPLLCDHRVGEVLLEPDAAL